jgi:uncharacterized protein
MGRILFFVLLGIGLWLAWRWWTVSAKNAARRGAERRADGENMVRCDVCGLNLPQSEALPLQQRWFCCEEHRQRGGS